MVENMVYTPIAGVYVTFIVSLIICGIIAYILGLFWFGDVKNRRWNSFFLLGIEMFVWTLLNAVSMVCHVTFFPVLYTLRMVTVCIVPFGIIWFILNFIESPLCRKYIRNLFIIIVSLDVLFLVSNPLHHLYFTDYAIPMPTAGIIFWIHTVVAFVSIGLMFVIYLTYMLKRAKENPLLVVAGIGMLLPYVYSIMYSFEMLQFTFDITPICFFFTFIFFVMAAYKSGMLTRNLELKTAQRTMEMIFESNPHMNVMFDDSFNIIDCNPTAVTLMGFDTKEDFINSFTSLMENRLPPTQQDNQPTLSIAGIFSVTVKEGFYKDEIHLNIKNEVRIFDLEMKKIPYGNGFAILGYMSDLTDRREKESTLAVRTQELEATQRTVAAMFESNPHMNFIFDSSFKIIDCNPSAYRFMGFENKQEMLAGFLDRMTSSIPQYQPGGRPSIPLAERFTAAAREGYSKFESELVINGENVVAGIEIRRIPYGESYALVGYITDLTSERERERELVLRDIQLGKAIEEAREANQAKSDFLASMSHEIRTPMNSILGFADLALDKVVSLQVRDYLIKIIDSTQWLLHIVNDILDLSKIESGKFELENVPFDLYSILTRCQSVIHQSASEKNLNLRIYTEPHIGKRLLGDPVKLYQALMNLLSNAVKFTKSGTVRMSSTITDSDDGTVTVYFEVKDSGIGMTQDQIARVFEPFTQADSSTTRNYGGTGLGLTITYNIIKMMGGVLNVESEIDVGSTFSFTITFKTTEFEGDILDEDEIITIEKPTFIGLVLICEDNIMNQQVLSEHLERVGINYVIAENGRIGVEMVKERKEKAQSPFDLIFMDIFMPVMDGIEAAEKIVALETGTPIVAMTANIMSNELEHYEKCGMIDYIGKPFTTQDLWRCLIKYIKPIHTTVESVDLQQKKNDELLHKIKQRFVKNNQNCYKEIMSAIAEDDMVLAHRLAHTLKNNAGQIRMIALQSIAADTEVLLKEGIVPTAEQMNNLEKAINNVLIELEALYDDSEEEVKVGNLDPEQILELYNVLEPMLYSFNSASVDMLENIRIIPGAEMLVKQIEDYDFELAAQTLNSLRKDMEEFYE